MILFNSDGGRIVVLNETASFVWHALENGLACPEIADEISRQTGAERRVGRARRAPDAHSERVNGKQSTTDGPFAETKEQLGGFYLINAKDLNDAIQVASRIPSARLGSVEVRPIMEFEQP